MTRGVEPVTIIAMPGSRRARANLLVLIVALPLAAACTPAPYEGIPDPPPGSERAFSPTTTAPPPTTTAAPPPSTTAPGDPQVSVPGEPLGATGVRITLPQGWQTRTEVDERSLLPSLADPLATTGLFTRRVLAATRADVGGPLAPSVMAFELPPGATPSAIGTLTALREAVGRTAASSEPQPEPSPLGDSAYVTYQWRAELHGAPVEVISEHYAFVRPGRVIVVLMTTTVERAAVDGRAFGAMLTSLTAAA